MPRRFGFGQRHGSRDLAGLPRSFDFSGSEAMLGHPLSIWDDYGVPSTYTKLRGWRPRRWYDIPADGGPARVMQEFEQTEVQFVGRF